MGQKVNPNGFRLGINRTWNSRWYADQDYAKLLKEDIEIRKQIQDRLKAAGVAKIIIERPAKNKAHITIHAAKPGIIIGKRGADIETLKKELSTKSGSDVQLNIVEVRKPELEAKLIAESIAQQMERRVSYKRAMKRAIQSAMRLGAGGVRIVCSGRLGGIEIARTEEYREGRVPLHTLRANVDYAEGTAFTTYGTCGVKVWVYKGDIYENDPVAQEERAKDQQANN